MNNKNSNGVVDSAFQEVNANPPSILKSTAKKFGIARAKKQQVAIALSKARKAGAKLPSPSLKSKA